MKNKMTWKKLILLSVIAGVLTGLINCIDILQDTSFTVPAATAELWLVLALWIVLQCENVKDAMVKTFIFFLISQPLVYLVEVPFKAAGWGLFAYYPYWGFMTVMTIPCAFLAWQIKRENLLSTVILSIGTASLGYSMIYYGLIMLDSFPRYLLHEIFCAVCIVIMIVKLIPEKKQRLLALVLTIAITLLVAKLTLFARPLLKGEIVLDPAHTWEVAGEYNGVKISNEGEGRFVYSTRIHGNELLKFVNENGEEVFVMITMNAEDTYAEIEE